MIFSDSKRPDVNSHRAGVVWRGLYVQPSKRFNHVSPASYIKHTNADRHGGFGQWDGAEIRDREEYRNTPSDDLPGSPTPGAIGSKKSFNTRATDTYIPRNAWASVTLTSPRNITTPSYALSQEHVSSPRNPTSPHHQRAGASGASPGSFFSRPRASTTPARSERANSAFSFDEVRIRSSSTPKDNRPVTSSGGSSSRRPSYQQATASSRRKSVDADALEVDAKNERRASIASRGSNSSGGNNFMHDPLAETSTSYRRSSFSSNSGGDVHYTNAPSSETEESKNSHDEYDEQSANEAYARRSVVRDQLKQLVSDKQSSRSNLVDSKNNPESWYMNEEEHLEVKRDMMVAQLWKQEQNKRSTQRAKQIEVARELTERRHQEKERLHFLLGDEQHRIQKAEKRVEHIEAIISGLNKDDRREHELSTGDTNNNNNNNNIAVLYVDTQIRGLDDQCAALYDEIKGVDQVLAGRQGRGSSVTTSSERDFKNQFSIPVRQQRKSMELPANSVLKTAYPY